MTLALRARKSSRTRRVLLALTGVVVALVVYAQVQPFDPNRIG